MKLAHLAEDQLPGTTVTLLGEDEGGEVRRTVLPGGVRVITERMPNVRSAAVGVWVGVGSRDEGPDEAGCSHYLEHLLFKGTARRSALEISAQVEAVGGDINAFTTKEYTCYYARVLDTDLPLAVDVVTDMVTSSLIRAEDVDAERGVVLEEIAMNEDDPADSVHEAFAVAFLGDSPLGRPILGTVDSITGMPRDVVDAYYRRMYTPDRLVFAVAGNVDHDVVVRLVTASLEACRVDLSQDRRPAPARIGGVPSPTRTGTKLVTRETEQANLVLGVPGIPRTDERRFALGVLNAALGGGMSSRLFQEVRERRGLAYSVYSYTSNYADLGMFGIYAGCQPKKVDEVLAICRDQLAAVAAEGLTDDELHRGIGQLRGSMVLGLEDTGSRMSRLGKSELVYGQLPSVDWILSEISAVTAADVRRIAAELLTVEPTLAVVGPFAEDRDFSAAVA